jgi:hypothetical protein
MANMNVGAWRRSDMPSRSYARTDINSASAANSFDDGLDFPPTAHPVRELITFSIFALAVVGFVVWSALKLL